MTPGQTFRNAVTEEHPLQIAGAVNAYCARLAERAGFRALYLSGAGVANASFGLPDLGYTTLDQVAEDVRRITSTTALPLLVDIDTGWEDDLFTGRTMKVMHAAGAAAVHLEDQVSMKRCGHRPGKTLVSTADMVTRVEAAVRSKPDSAMVLMARTDAAAVEGLTAAIDRASAYVAAGADMIFAEALTSLDEYTTFTSAIRVPVLANITEFGKTPLFTTGDLAGVGIAMVLYPLSAFRAMSAVARDVYAAIRGDGTQKNVIDRMQTRVELYDVLNYAEYERKADEALKNKR